MIRFKFVQVKINLNPNNNVLEIIRCSSFIPAYLNRQAITLLSALGVPDKIFIDMKDLQVNELKIITGTCVVYRNPCFYT